MKKVIIIGDSTHNTLSAVRSFGEGKVPFTLILVCQQDNCYVRYSKYLRHGNLYVISELDECTVVLRQLAAEKGQLLMTTFDAAAEWVDAREFQLSEFFLTPCRGKQLGVLFNKEAQCKLAEECGLIVPHSIVYHRGKRIPEDLLYPVITKPLVSSKGEKSDIHICHSKNELAYALGQVSRSDYLIIQEFVEKEYEIDAVGVSTEQGVIMGGAIHKYRHWPRLVGAGAFGVFECMNQFNVDIAAISRFIKKSGYHGPFSVEFLHTKEGKNYFMEVNFRNEGLAYASTCAGANLHALYADSSHKIDWSKFRRTYIMNYSIDLLYVKGGDIPLWHWLKDFLKTRCFINICLTDLGPTLAYYKHKIFNK